MWIFADWLKKYEPKLFINEGSLGIETVRLFSSEIEADDNCMYIGRTNDLFIHANNDIICTHKNDIIILATNDINEIMNQVLNAFEFYQRWNVRTLEAISSDMRPTAFLSIANEVIKEPIYLMDSNQYAIALSDGYGLGEVNDLWDDMILTGTSDYNFLSKLNAEYPIHRTRRGLYYFNAPFSDNHSYNYNMFLADNWIGLCSLVERRETIPQVTLDLFQIFCENIKLWFVSHSQEQRSMMIDSLLRESLMSEGTASENFIRQYRLRFHETDLINHIICLKADEDKSFLSGHLCRELNLLFTNLIAIIYRDYICILITAPKNSTINIFDELKPIIKRASFYGGISSSFTELDHISSAFNEAAFAADRCENVPGKLVSFNSLVLEWSIDSLKQSTSIDPVHPDVRMLIDYDSKHNTEFAPTLEAYLKKERSQSRTAAALSLHRNTLTYRLSRIRDLISCDLDDDDTRLHLILSFKFIS